MFNKKTDQNEGPLLTVMGASARLEGKFNITESIQIECEVAGEINVDGKLVSFFVKHRRSPSNLRIKHGSCQSIPYGELNIIT